MTRLIGICLLVTLVALVPGCLVTGVITIIENVDIDATTDNVISKYDLDLNQNQDYVDNKDAILSIDDVALVAIIKNNTSTAVNAEVWFTTDITSYTTVSQIQSNGLRFMLSPAIPPNAEITIDWNSAFQFIENEETVIEQVLGDGMMTFYGIANNTPFDLNIQAQIAVTMTVEK